jgi:hypothetical protein
MLDAVRREHHVGLGCALENLVLAARARGYQTHVTLVPSPDDQAHVARIDLTRAPRVKSPLYEAIGRRHTNRGPYKRTRVPAAELDTLSAHAADLDGTSVRWFSTATDKAALGTLIIEATQAIVGDQQQSAESFAWFRSSRDAIDTHRDGLTLDGQGLNALTLAAAKLLPATSRVAGDKFWLTQTKTVHTATAAAYGVIVVPDTDDIKLRVTGGRLLQRIHLAATAAGLALQHMNQVTERIDRERQQHLPANFGPRFAALLASAPQQGLVTFRIGYPTRTTRPSPRRALSAVTSPSARPSSPARTPRPASATSRQHIAAALGGLGGFLGLLAGAIQALIGARIPAWSGAKASPFALGVLTMLLAAVGVGAALAFRGGLRATPERRAAVIVGLLVPALLCFSTVGRLWYIPGTLLLAASGYSVGAGGPREVGGVFARNWLRILLSVLGACELLMAAAAAPVVIAAVGLSGGLALLAAPWPKQPKLTVVLVIVGAGPFTVLTWWSVATPLLTVLAVVITIALTRRQRHLAPGPV